MGDDFSAVRDRPVYAPLSPDAERAFLQQQATFESAYRATRDPLILWSALVHVWGSRQTIPGWLVGPIGDALIERRTDEAAERYRERVRHVQRYVVVDRLRREKGKTKDEALDAAVEVLAADGAAAARSTIEDSYDNVRRSLDRQGRESQFFHLVDLVGRVPNPFADPSPP